MPSDAPSRAYAKSPELVRLSVMANTRATVSHAQPIEVGTAPAKRAPERTTPDRAQLSGEAAPPTQHELLLLQRTAGNAAVCQLLEERGAGAPPTPTLPHKGGGRSSEALSDKEGGSFSEALTHDGGESFSEALTHQGGETVVQRGFFSSIGKFFSGAAKAVGSAVSGIARGVGKALRSVGSALGSAARWVYARLGDAGEWLVNLFKDLPQRLLRFGQTVAEGLLGAVTLIPEAIGSLISGGIGGFASWVWQKAKSGAAWLGTMLTRVFDLIGGPEIVEFVLHMLSNATPLKANERTAAQGVLGANALRWDDVRIDEGGVLGLVFKLNGGRAFTTFHSINMTAADRSNLSIVVHELTHVDQYEHAGSVYIGQALGDQIAEGSHAYNYGGTSGLVADRRAGKHYADYGRERQAQIAQDYYVDKTAGTPTPAYDPYIVELQRGEL
jgi:hypothetical protein